MKKTDKDKAKNTTNPYTDASDIDTSRRSFNQRLLAMGLTAAMWPYVGEVEANRSKRFRMVDYIVVGAGAGGGPVAARLVEAGYTVAVIEAGLDPEGQDAANIDPSTGILYKVPAFAAVTAEHPLLSWDFYVKHYKNQELFPPDRLDSKWVKINGVDKGILYPRGSALGGSTAHNAMLFIYPHDQDWDDIAELTGDASWNANSMRNYFQRLEKCEYCQPDAPGHGFDGYMNASLFDEQIFKLAPEIRDLAEAGQPNMPRDANADDPTGIAQGATGAFKTPMHVATPVRISIREHLLKTRSRYPNKLFLITGALATKILTRDKHAIGIEFLQNTRPHGPDNNLYEADKRYDPNITPQSVTLYARKEVILSAGVYNTPQLLKLSGIGPKEELEAHGIKTVLDLPGVGENLQDRYEISVNARLNTPLNLYKECNPLNPTSDPCLQAWATGQGLGGTFPFYGPYANNAAYSGRIEKSDPSRKLPDLFLVGQATAFNGFVPGFSGMPFGQTWTWLILKAHTNNTKGTVTLKSANPREMPEIQFNYFEEGGNEDLRAVVKGIKDARSFLNHPQAKQHVAQEISPGSDIQEDAELERYVRKEAWGHHASCTAKIGADDDPMAVLDSRFRVRGMKGLRVVDACVFPRVPGFFPLAAIMMIGEKAGDVIIEDARNDNDKDKEKEKENMQKEKAPVT
jgi:choline dehydrogenase